MVKTYKAYTGVGSRSTPKDIQKVMYSLAFKLAQEGYILRSGGAEGADTAFEDGWWEEHQSLDIYTVEQKAELYIPWLGFNNHDLSNFDGCNIFPSQLKNWEEAKRIASKIHPAWDKLPQGAKILHARNCYQVLGKDLATPSKFLVCWAEVDSKKVPKGGTRTAWALAQEYEVPCLNLIFPEDLERINFYLEV